MDVKPTKLSFDPKSGASLIPMGFTTKTKLKILATETAVPVGKTQNGREIYAIIDKNQFKNIKDIDNLKKSAMAFIKKHPTLTNTNLAKFNVPVENEGKTKAPAKKVVVVSPDQKYKKVPADQKVLSLKSHLRKKLDFSSDSSYSSLSDSARSSGTFTPEPFSSFRDPLEAFYFDGTSRLMDDCQAKCKDLKDTLKFYWPNRKERPEIIVVALKAMKDLEKIEPENFNVNIELTEQLTLKIDEMKRFLEDVVAGKEVDEDALQFKVLSFIRLIQEVVLIAQIPEEVFILDAIVDEEAKERWVDSLSKENAFGERKYRQPYQVPFEDFYQMVILDVFPEKKNDPEFKAFISSLINFADEKNISAWTWNLFVEAAGSVGEFRELVLANETNPEFKMDYLTELANSI